MGKIFCYFCEDFQDYEITVQCLKTSSYWLGYSTARHTAVY